MEHTAGTGRFKCRERKRTENFVGVGKFSRPVFVESYRLLTYVPSWLVML